MGLCRRPGARAGDKALRSVQSAGVPAEATNRRSSEPERCEQSVSDVRGDSPHPRPLCKFGSATAYQTLGRGYGWRPHLVVTGRPTMTDDVRPPSQSRRRRAAIVLIMCALIVGLMVAAVGHARADEAWRSKLEHFIDGATTTILDQHAVAGAVVTVVSGDEVIVSRGYRTADAETGRLMDPQTDPIPLASGTKVFTALAVLQAVEEGKLGLLDPIAKHLPDTAIEQPFGDITVRDLLGHMAGLEERYAGYFASVMSTGDPSATSLGDILPRQVRPPSETIAYSNASYVLLGRIIAETSGLSFRDYIDRRFLAPLNAGRAGFMSEAVWHDGTVRPNHAHVWRSGRYTPWTPAPFPEHHLPSGGLAMTAAEVGRFMQAVLQGGRLQGRQIFTATTIARMTDPLAADRPDMAGRTLAFWAEEWAGHRVYHHGGSHFGFHALMVLVPSLDLGFFVAANSPSGSALTGLPRRVMREVISPGARPVVAQQTCDARCLEPYVGRFVTTRRNESGIDRLHALYANTIHVAAAGSDSLLVSGLGHTRLFKAIGTDQFMTNEGDMRLGFARGEAGSIERAFIRGGAQTFDRQGFWLRSASLQSGLLAVLVGVALCLTVAWRTKTQSPRAKNVPIVLAAVWTGLLIGMAALVAHVLTIYGLSHAAEPSIILWAMTGLFAVGAASVVAGLVWSAMSMRNAGRFRVAYAVMPVALALFVWALVVAWVWNLPTAALFWSLPASALS